MPAPLVLFAALRHCLITVTIVLLDFGRFVTIGVRSRRALAAENLFLRKQLALFQERKVKPRRADDSTRWMMATLSRMFEWRDALWNVKPKRSLAGIAKAFGCFGVGNPSRREDPGC
jgi:putative transposase